jgi:hypothetical protein
LCMCHWPHLPLLSHGHCLRENSKIDY